MKPCVLIISLLVLFLPFSPRAQEKQAASLDTNVSFQIEDGLLIDLFNRISMQTGIYFSYDPMLVNSNQSVSLVVKQQSVRQVLETIFNHEFHFKLLKNQLIITRKKNQQITPTNEKTVPLRFNLSGQLIDSKNKSTIPYASISVLGHPFGTISNIDGEFQLKIPSEYESDTLVISCLGYARRSILLDTLQHNEFQLQLDPVEIQLREVKVTAADPLKILDNMIDNISKNYSTNIQLMSSFYREVLKQDKEYINVCEAVMDILKSPYTNQLRQDQIRYLKGRKSPDIQTSFKLIDFKMEGGPYYITKLDVIKTMDSFIDPEFREHYKYKVERVIEYLNRPTYIVWFEPDGKLDYLTYEGHFYIDQETFALVHAEFSLSRNGKKSARKSLIKKKPRGFNVRPIDLNYSVTYKKYNNKWYLNSARASVKFHVKSKHDKVNSVFHSISDLLITDYRETNLRRFKRSENFNSTDIFSEQIKDYDEDFWGNYNIIKPSEDLRKAFKKESSRESFFHSKSEPNRLTLQKN